MLNLSTEEPASRIVRARRLSTSWSQIQAMNHDLCVCTLAIDLDCHNSTASATTSRSDARSLDISSLINCSDAPGSHEHGPDCDHLAMDTIELNTPTRITQSGVSAAPQWGPQVTLRFTVCDSWSEGDQSMRVSKLLTNESRWCGQIHTGLLISRTADGTQGVDHKFNRPGTT